MATTTDRDMILTHLRERPSVSSAIAIGHYHVLNGAPLSIAIKALNALEEMPCDWTVVILEQAALDPERPPVVRQRAVSKIRRLLIEAIWRGYGGISKREVIAKSRDARRAVASWPTHAPDTQQDIDDLASHLAQAIADGYFGTLREE